MLKKIKIKNFYSIGEEQEISFEIKEKDLQNESTRKIEGPDIFLNTVACILGANASGKTNFLKALAFLAYFIEKSYQKNTEKDKIPVRAHKLRQKEPISFELEFLEKTALESKENYRDYRYKIALTEEKVLSESLEEKELIRGEKNRFRNVFSLNRNDKKTVIKTAFNFNKNDEERLKDRKNISLLSALKTLGYLKNINFFEQLSSNVHHRGKISFPFIFFEEFSFEEAKKEEILHFLQRSDFGITEINFKEKKTATEEEKNNEEKEEEKIRKILNLVHRCSSGAEFTLPFKEESNGTQNAIRLLVKDIYPVLEKGGILVWDELEESLHPEIAGRIVALFGNRKSNPHHAQLIFSTHQPLLLKDRTKTQIFLTEKNNNTLETEIYRLDDVEGVRNDDNFFAKYLSGAYGGTPHLKIL